MRERAPEDVSYERRATLRIGVDREAPNLGAPSPKTHASERIGSRTR